MFIILSELSYVSCIIVNSLLPHTLLFFSGPRSDIWEAEGGELLLSKGGGQAGDAHQGSLNCSWQGHR